MKSTWFAFLAALIVGISDAHALRMSECLPLSDDMAAESRDEHIFGGRPDKDAPTELFERRGYVITYDAEMKTPIWAAWRALPEYRSTPKREGKWSSFRTEPEIDTAHTDDYIGWFDSEKNYARGHIVPYFISGGDRDGDGADAEFETTLAIEDKDDACTVYEINSMINIAPQAHDSFNGRPGLWWDLETDVRLIIDDQRRLYLFAGTVFAENTVVDKIGDRDELASTWDISVPHGFWKIVIDANSREAVGFLFDHAADIPNGCSLDTEWPSGCIVDIETIEAATGLTFFTEVEATIANAMRQSSTNSTWLRWIAQ